MNAPYFLLACLLAGAYSQTTSDCGATSFNFYNGLEQGREFLWDWRGNSFNGGTDNAFDGFFYVDIIVNGTTYAIADFFNPPTAYVCNITETFSLATYTLTITETFEVYRTFYAPRATSWIRIIDTFRNLGTELVLVSAKYNGNMGSDDNTIFNEVTNYTVVSMDSSGSDPAFSMNWAGEGGLIVPTIISGFVSTFDEEDWRFDEILIPEGESRSIMTIIAQRDTPNQASAQAHHIRTMPVEIFPEISSEQISTLVNWDLCTLQFAIVDAKEVYCTNPAEVSVTVNAAAVVTFGGSTAEHADQFTVTLQNGTNTLSYVRASTQCVPLTKTFTVTVPDEDISLAVSWPALTASGGYGEYTYLWDFGSSDVGTNFNNVFGKNATVTVVDKKLCSASFIVPVPAMQVTPVADNVPVAAAPRKVSSSTQLTATLFGLAAMLLSL